MRSPEKLVADAKLTSTFSRTPIFMVHDHRIGGIERSSRFFELFAAAKITIESPDPEIRRVNGKFPVSNAIVEQTLAAPVTPAPAPAAHLNASVNCG